MKKLFNILHFNRDKPTEPKPTEPKTMLERYISVLIDETKNNNIFWKQVGDEFFSLYYMDQNFLGYFTNVFGRHIGLPDLRSSAKNYIKVMSNNTLTIGKVPCSLEVPKELLIAIKEQINSNQPFPIRDLVLELSRLEDLTEKNIIKWELKAIGGGLGAKYFLPEVEGFSILNKAIVQDSTTLIKCPPSLLEVVENQVSMEEEREKKKLIFKTSESIENYIQKEKSK